MIAPDFFEIQQIIGSDSAINFYLVNAGVRKGYLAYFSFLTEDTCIEHQKLIKNIIETKYDNLSMHISGFNHSSNGRFILEYIICGKKYYKYVKKTFNNYSHNKCIKIGKFLGYLTPHDINKIKRKPDYSILIELYGLKECYQYSGIKNSIIKYNNPVHIYAFACLKENMYPELFNDIVKDVEKIRECLKNYIPNTTVNGSLSTI